MLGSAGVSSKSWAAWQHEIGLVLHMPMRLSPSPAPPSTSLTVARDVDDAALGQVVDIDLILGSLIRARHPLDRQDAEFVGVRALAELFALEGRGDLDPLRAAGHPRQVEDRAIPLKGFLIDREGELVAKAGRIVAGIQVVAGLVCRIELVLDAVIPEEFARVLTLRDVNVVEDAAGDVHVVWLRRFQPMMWANLHRAGVQPAAVDVLAGKAVNREQGLAENPVLIEGHRSPVAVVAVDDGHVAVGEIHGDQQLARRLVGLGGNHKAQ